MVHQIMEEERGVALRLLYQIKLAAQRLENADKASDPEEPSMTNLKNGTLHKVLQKHKEEVLNLSSSIKYPTVDGKDARSNKQKLLDQRIVGFEVNQKKLFDSALEAQRAEMTLIQKIAQEQRSLQQTKLFENQTFMKEWMAEGQEKWKLNQERRAQAIEKVKYFEDREVNIYKAKLNKELNEATYEMGFGISDFEKNLQKLGIQQNISMADAVKRMEEKKGIPPGQIQNFSYAATMNKIKETKKNSDFAGKERDRRRRKMTVDQLNAQTKLDAQAYEEQLIAKLLAQTEKEQEESYIQQRTQICKNIDFEARKAKALQLDEKLKRENEIADEQKRLQAKNIEAERKLKDEQRRKDLKALRRKEKAKTRTLNVEIASELVDLVLDLADETFEAVIQDQSGQIQKPVWRSFVDIFKQGKKVSLRNVIQQPAKEVKNQTENTFKISQDAQAHEILKMFSQDKSLATLYDYLAGINQFDIGRLRQDLWDQYEFNYLQQQSSSTKQIDTKIQRNSDLVSLIESLYSMVRGGSHTELEAQQSQIFQNLNIKLSIIGSAFSGKKTIAKQLQELLGQDVTIFNINEIIKEAIDYISPKKVEEVVVDPKAKGKSKPVVEAAAIDIFEGKNVVKYKQTAQAIKEQFLAGEQLPRKVDIVELVLDDSLLTTLVVERLKLQFEGKNFTKGGPDDIKAGLIREQEILKQLDELELLAIQAAADPKSKAAKPSKGGPDPEKLQQELEEIRKFKPIGWILVDYPKTQSQIKLLEQELSGFIAKVDQQKPEKLEIQETWQKIVLDEDDQPTEIASNKPRQSGLDAILFLNTAQTECLKRGVGRKIDPSTQNIYNPGELPSDPKTLEKLQDFNDEAGDQKRINQSAELFTKRISSISKWSEQFGLLNEEGLCVVQLGQQIESSNWQSKESVKEAAISKLKLVLDYKQQQFDAKRIAVKQSQSQPQISQHGSQLINNQPSSKELLVQDNLSNHQSHLKSKTNIQSDKGEGAKRILSDTVGDGKSSMGGTTNKSAARRKNQPRFEINDNQKINRWEEMLNEYFRQSIVNFTSLSKQRRTIVELYEDSQTRYIDFICREMPYQKKVAEFVDSFNRFSQEYPDLRSNPETKSELLKRVTILSNQLWEQILERKNQAVDEREKFTQEMLQGWSTHEIAKLIANLSSLMQNEFEKLRTVVAVTTGWVWNEEVDLVNLCAKLDEKAVSTFAKNPQGQPQSPMFEQVIQYVQSCVQQLMQEQFVQQTDQKSQGIINRELINFNYRCNTLRVYGLCLLEEINDQTEHVSEAFQSWIITSVKKENSVCQAIVGQIKKQIENDATYLGNLTLENPRLDRIIERVDLKGAIISKGSVSGMSQFNQTLRRFDIKTLRQLFSQFVKNSQEQLLDSQTFITLMLRCYQSLKMPSVFRSKSFRHVFDLVEKFAARPLGNEADSDMNPFSTEQSQSSQYINWKKTQIFLTLFTSTIPTSEEFESLQQSLLKFGQKISLKDFIETEMWFDEYESTNFDKQPSQSQINSDTEDDTIDYARLTDIKELLWLTVKRTNENQVIVQDFLEIIGVLSKQATENHDHPAQFCNILEF